MATIEHVRESTTNTQTMVVSWGAMQSGDVGTPVDFSQYADRSVQTSGTFGVGGSVRIEGTINGTDYAPLTDPQGNDLDLTGPKIESISELVRYIRPRVVAGDGATSINVHIIMKAVV
jgi:hypothetical protein